MKKYYMEEEDVKKADKIKKLLEDSRTSSQTTCSKGI